jgi:hypothetical protein
VWNYGRGDGLEKALCLMNIIQKRFPQDSVVLDGDTRTPVVRHGGREYRFKGDKRVAFPKAEDF